MVTFRPIADVVIAAPTLVTAADMGAGFFVDSARAAVPSPPEPSEIYDLSDLLTDAANVTANLITISIHPDGTAAAFTLPRAEVGQGITTAVAMTNATHIYGMSVTSVS